MGLLNSWPWQGDDDDIDPSSWNGMLGFGPRAPGVGGSGAGQPVAPGPASDDTIQPTRLAQASTTPASTRAAAPTASRGAGGYTPMSAEDIGNIVFNETQGLSGDDVPLARLQLAESIMNAEDRWGAKRSERAGTPPPTLPARMDAHQRQILQDVYGTVQQAIVLRSLGLDTTNGATNYNMRTTDDMSPPGKWPKYRMERRWGPFQSSGTPYHYVDIWQNPDARK